MCATTVQAYAMDASYDRDTNVVTINGTAQKNEQLAIVITDKEVGSLNGAYESLMETHGIGFYEVDANENGEYSLTVTMNNFDGPYNVFVSGSETKDNGRLEKIKTLIEKLNSMVNKVQVKELIGELQTEHGGDAAIYSKYFGLSNTDSIDKAVYDKKPYGSLSETYDVFEKAVKNYRPQVGSTSGGGGGTIALPSGNPSGAAEAIGKPAVHTFADVSPEFWGTEAINELYKMGIVNGVSANEFAPNKDIKREEFVKMLVALIGLDVNGTPDNFIDTDKNAWYSPYLAVAKECGLVYGKDDGSFGVGEVLTRQDMAVLAAKALGTAQRGVAVEFADANEISDYAKDSVEILCGLKVMNGVGDGNFAPKGTATRAQAARVIYEIAKLIK